MHTRLKTQRRAIYVATGLAVLSLIGGFAVASFSVGGMQTNQQGSQTTNIDAVTGIVFNGTNLSLGGSGIAATGSCAWGAPCDVTNTGLTLCAGGYAAATCNGRWVEEVNFTTVAATPFSGTLLLELFVTIGGHVYTGAAIALTDASGNAAVPVVLDFDVQTAGGAPAAVTSVSVTANVVQ